MRLILRLPAVLALLLLAACAQRTYVVYPPQLAGDPGPDTCAIDFGPVILGKWTVRQLEEWAAAAKVKPRCKGLDLRFHRPGQSIRDPGISPAPDDRVHQLILDSAPERPALRYPPIIHAIVGDKVVADGPGPAPKIGTPATTCPSQGQCSTQGPIGPATVQPATAVTGPVGLPPTAPEPEPGEKDPEGAGDPQPPVIAGPGPSAVDDDDSGPAGRGPSGKPDGEAPSALAEALPPALLGGGLVYVLALMKLLPFTGAPAGPLPLRPGRPAWSFEKPETPAAAIASAPAESTESGDRRVRLRWKGFDS